MKNKIGALLLSLCSLTAMAQSQIDATSFAKELSAKSSTIETIVCDFTETRHMDILADDLVRNGKFSYKRPERMLLAFDSGDKILMTPDHFVLQANGRNLTSKMSANPMLRQMQTVFGACMTGNVEQLLGGGKIAITLAGKEYTLRFVPSARSAQKYVSAIVLVFDCGDMTLTQLRMEQPSGDYTLYRFRNKRIGVPIEDTLFRIE